MLDNNANEQLLDALREAGPFEVQCRWVTPRLAIGGMIATVDNMRRLHAAGVTNVINLQAEFDDRTICATTPIEVEWVPLPNGQPVSKESLRTAIAAARRVMSAEDCRLYVHCLAGQHRAPLVAYALLRDGGVTAGSAIDAITSAEPRACLERDDCALVERTLADM